MESKLVEVGKIKKNKQLATYLTCFFSLTLSFFLILIMQLHTWLFLFFLFIKYTVGMTYRLDLVKIGVLQKELNMRGNFCHFF